MTKKIKSQKNQKKPFHKFKLICKSRIAQHKVLFITKIYLFYLFINLFNSINFKMGGPNDNYGNNNGYNNNGNQNQGQRYDNYGNGNNNGYKN